MRVTRAARFSVNSKLPSGLCDGPFSALETFADDLIGVPAFTTPAIAGVVSAAARASEAASAKMEARSATSASPGNRISIFAHLRS